MDELTKIPGVAWLGLAALAGLGVLMLHHYSVDPEDQNWLDPGQPPLNMKMDFATSQLGNVTRRTPSTRAPKWYANANLWASPDFWVGDV